MCLITRVLEHSLTAFTGSFTCNINSQPSSTHESVDAVSISSCIVPTIINDPARVPEHEILTVSTGVKIILADLGSTCNVLLSPAVLTLLVDWDQYFTVLIIQSLCCHACSVRQRTGHRDLAHSFQIIQTTRSRSSTGRRHPRLGNSLPRTETASLLVRVDDHVRLVLGRYVEVLLPDFVVGFHAFLRVLLACCWHCSSVVHGFWGPGPWLFLLHGFSGPFPGCFYFFTAIWHVIQPAYSSPPWSESQRCPRSLRTAS